jgi:hypothetical protein
MRFPLLFLIALVVLWGCEKGRKIDSKEERVREEDDIREATFRYQFLHNASAQQQKAKVYFLSFGEERINPSDDFMKRFANHKPMVKKVSQATDGDIEGIKHKDTGEKGIIFNVTKIKWVNDLEVEVDGGYYEGNVSSSGNKYRLKKKEGKWVVIEDVMNWIS